MGAIRFFSCGTARRFLSGLVAGVFLFSTAFANVGAAFAATPDVATTGSASAGAVPAASQAASPTVVREIEESRTPVSNTYLLSDGTYRQEIYEKPVNYQPSGETTLQPIDTSLVPSAAFGVSQTKASGFPETFASGDETATPVSVAGDGWRVGMRMVGGNLDDPLALGQSANYPFAAPATQLTYTAKSDGFEDMLTLSDPSAPDTFVFYMALDNLSIFQNPSGGWALRDGKNGQIVGNLGEYRVFDSSGTDPLAPGAQCPSATMDVRAVPGGAYITYHVPREWLDDPARAYPVKVDPTLYFYYPNAGSNDTFIAKGNPYNYYGSSTDMYVGDWSTKGNYCRSMLWYSMGSIPQGVTVTGATLSLYCCSSNAGGSTTVNVGRLKNGFAWTSTWAQIMGSASNSDINIMAQPWTYKSQAAGNNVWWTFDVKSLVQSWFDGSATNYGFAVYSNNEGGGTGYFKDFRTSEYGSGSTYRPHLTVSYTDPAFSGGSFDQRSYKPGDTVNATVNVATRVRPTFVQVDVRSGSVNRGRFYYSSFDPGNENLQTYKKPGTSEYYSFDRYPGSDYATGAVVPDLTSCSTTFDGTTFRAHFAYRIGTTYGSMQNNTLWAQVWDWATTPMSNLGASYSVLPGPAPMPAVSTTASAGWCATSTGPSDDNSAGRGSVKMSWVAPTGASTYDIYLFNGNTYEKVASTNATSWSSAGAVHFPSDSAIASLPAGYTGSCFATGTLDLRDDPRALYAKTAGTAWDNVPSYAFKIVPGSSVGTLALSDVPTIAVTLDSRTIHANDDITHATADLASIAGQSAECQLDSGALSMSATDLSLKSYGPDAPLSRAYVSSDASGHDFGGPGWRFGYEQSIVSTLSTVAVYTDEAGDAHHFTKVGDAWVAPTGDYDVLSGDSTNGWTLAHKDRSVSSFTRDEGDSSTRWISAETDNNSQTVTYVRDGNTMTITAANGQTITFTRQGGGDASAAYSTAAGSRNVGYHYEEAADRQTATATVAYSFTGTPATAGYSVDYLYTSGKLTSMHVNTPQPLRFQPTSCAAWDFAYEGARVSTVTAPYFASGQRSTVAATTATDSAGLAVVNLTRSGVQVGGVDAETIESFGLNPSGTLAYKTNARVATETAKTWSYAYSATGEQCAETNPDGATRGGAFDGRGNEIQQRDELGRTTTNVYDALDQRVSSTDARGSVTTNAYDDAGNLRWTERLLDKSTGDTARTEYGYDTHGRKTFERKRLFVDTNSVNHWLYTGCDYTGSDTDDPATTTKKGQTGAPGAANFADESISLSSTTSVNSIVTSVVHDAFGSVTRSTDASGNSIDSTFDLAGRTLTGKDPSGAGTNQVYDVLGNEVASWQSTDTALGTVTANYKESTFDPFGRAITENYFRTSGDTGTKAADRVVTHTFDAAGRETGAIDTFASGCASKTEYDARGNVLESWAQGVPDYGDDHATISSFDAENRTRTQSVPGTSSASVTEYNADGTTARVTAADGSVTSSAYDPQTGDKTSDTGAQGTTTYAYDAGGRLVAQTDAAGMTTANTYDLADRQNSAASQGTHNTTGSGTTYNALDWVISKKDADSIVTSDIFDVCGRQVFDQVGTSAPTVTRYDASGRTIRQDGADGTLTNQYDPFGRTSRETHVDASGQMVKDIATVCDSMGRVTSTHDCMTGVDRTTSYPTVAGGSTVSGISYGSVATSVTVDAAGLERTRVTRIPLLSDVTRSIDATDPGGRTTRWSLDTGLTQSSGFDTGGRLVKQWGSGFSGSGDTTSYAFDTTTGRKTADDLELAFGGAITTTYGYTAAGRLSTVTAPGETFGYDNGGDVTALTAVSFAGWPASGVLTYDENCRLVSMNDAAGNALVTYGFDTAKGWRSWQKAASDTAATTFGYSDSGRLTSFSKPAGALGDPASVVATYGYDASGQRVRSTVTSGTGGSAVSTATAFTYDGLTLLSLASARTAGGASSTWSIAYLYSETGRPYAGVYRAGTATPTVFGMVVTDRGDVVALTDAAGNPFAAYRYDAWGRPLSVSTQSVSDSIAATLAADIAARQPLRYAGYVWDAESQTYNLSARTYDPATMQFLQKDPAKADGEASAYQYCGGDPVGKVDPSGNWEILARYRIYPGNVGGWNRNLSYRGFAGWVAAEIGPAIAEEILGRVIPVSKVRTLFGLTTNGASMVSLGKAMQTSWGQFKEYDTVYLERSSWAYPSQDLHMKAWGYFHFVMMRWFVTRWHSSRTMSVMLYPKYVSGMYRHNGRSVRVTPHDFATRVRKGLVL